MADVAGAPAPPAQPAAEPEPQGMDSSAYFRYDVSWPSFEDAMTEFRATAQQHGFALRIQSRRPRADNFDRVRIACSKGRKPRDGKEETPVKNAMARRRNRTSARSDCPFNINMKRQRYTNVWVISKVDPVHNHGGDDAGAFPQYRMAELEKYRATILAKHALGKKPLGIIGELQYELQVEVMFTAKDINNFLNRYKELEADRKMLFEGGLLNERQEQTLVREAQRMLDLIAANKRRRTGVELVEGQQGHPEHQAHPGQESAHFMPMAQAMTPDVTLLQGVQDDDSMAQDDSAED